MAFLNRLYIVVGMLAILVLLAGFIVPPLINWSSYRARLETVAEVNLGMEVVIAGEIDFVLLPKPKIRLGNIIVGPKNSPLAEIDTIVANFSLLEILRDRLTITNLVLQSPTLNIIIENSGELKLPLSLGENFGNRKISVATVEIFAGDFNVIDERINNTRGLKNIGFTDFEGELQVSNINGPFRLQGSALANGKRNRLRVSLSAINEKQEAQTSFFWRPEDGAYTITGKGLLELGARPNFSGDGNLRISRAVPDEGELVRGDMVFSSTVELSSEKLLFANFDLQPDENRVGSRLSGAAVIQFGELQNFDVVVSGNVLKLAPVDILDQGKGSTDELFAMLNHLPTLGIPSMPGRIGVDIVDLGLGNVSLRNVRIDALSDGQKWEIGELSAKLPGNSIFTFAGETFLDGGEFAFAGTSSVQTDRLGTLAQLWTNDKSSGQLFALSAQLNSDVRLQNNILDLSNVKLIMDGVEHEFAASLQLSGQRSALLSARIAPIDASQSKNLISLLPQFLSEGKFPGGFATGSLDISLQQAVLFDLDAKNASLQLDWNANEILVNRLLVEDIGGAKLDLSGGVLTNISTPQIYGQIYGNGQVLLNERAGKNFLPVALSYFGADPLLQDWAARSLPIDAYVNLNQSEENSSQILWLKGGGGATDFEIEIEMANGIKNLLNSSVVMAAQLTSTEGDLLSRQLGMGNALLFPVGENVKIAAGIEGIISEQVEANIQMDFGAQSLKYSGMLDIFDLKNITAQGNVEFDLDGFSQISKLLGAGQLYLPAATGSADFTYGPNEKTGVKKLLIPGDLGEFNPLQGGFEIAFVNGQKTVLGQVDVGGLEIEQLFSILASPASLLRGEGIWPDGPLDFGINSRPSSGEIAVSVPRVSAGGKVLVTDVYFDLIWDQASIGIDNFRGKNGDGEIIGSFSFCCSSNIAQKQMSGRLTINGVAIDGFGLEGGGENINGKLDVGMSFEANGASFGEFIASLSAQGSFSVVDLAIDKMNSQVFAALFAVENIADFDELEFLSLLKSELEQGSLQAQGVGGTFVVAGGVLRAGNIAINAENASLLGGLILDLKDISLSGNWLFQPEVTVHESNVGELTNASIGVIIGGTLLAPTTELDISQMIDAVQLRAMEIELERLEKLRAEQEARSREAALERARRMELYAIENQNQPESSGDEGQTSQGNSPTNNGVEEITPLPDFQLDTQGEPTFLLDPQSF